MQLVKPGCHLRELSPQQVESEIDAALPGRLVCKISLARNSDARAPYVAVKLLLSVGERRGYEFAFREEPPLAPLRTCGTTAFTLLGCTGADFAEEVYDLLSTAGNRAYTPIARFAIRRQGKRIALHLKIGSWQAERRMKFETFKRRLNL